MPELMFNFFKRAEPKPDKYPAFTQDGFHRHEWYYGNYQTGLRSPWTGDHVGRWERHCLDCNEMQMGGRDAKHANQFVEDDYVTYQKGDKFDTAWLEHTQKYLDTARAN